MLQFYNRYDIFIETILEDFFEVWTFYIEEKI